MRSAPWNLSIMVVHVQHSSRWKYFRSRLEARLNCLNHATQSPYAGKRTEILLFNSSQLSSASDPFDLATSDRFHSQSLTFSESDTSQAMPNSVLTAVSMVRNYLKGNPAISLLFACRWWIMLSWNYLTRGKLEILTVLGWSLHALSHS